MENDRYLAQGECINCGKEDYPQWGTYEFGRQISSYRCVYCGCMTWRPRKEENKLSDEEVGTTSDNIHNC